MALRQENWWLHKPTLDLKLVNEQGPLEDLRPVVVRAGSVALVCLS